MGLKGMGLMVVWWDTGVKRGDGGDSGGGEGASI
jgi:hypothetical protein